MRRFSRGSFKQRVINAMTSTYGWKLTQYKSHNKITAPAQFTVYWGTDVGLGSTGITWNNGGQSISGTSGDGDILACAKTVNAGATTTTNFKFQMKFSTVHLTLRNQGNFGCHVKVYWVKVPMHNTIPDRDTINEILALLVGGGNATVGGNSSSDTQHSDLTDLPNTPQYMKIVSRKSFSFMPGETKSFKLSTYTPMVNNATANFRSRNKYTRSIIFQITGFPLHDQAVETSIGSSPISIDVQQLHRCKGVVGLSGSSNRTSTSLGTTITNPVGQQWQTGLPNTAFGA